MTTIATIVARAGSKRLPGKNTMDFCGHPLVAWSIIQARACEKIEEIYVSTDSEEIAEISREYGATVLMREDPRESLDPTTGGVPLGIMSRKIMELRHVDAFLQLFPTSPLRKPSDFDRLIQAYEFTGKAHSFYAAIKDAFIYKKIDYHTCRQVIRDKTDSYLYELGGFNILSAESFKHPRLDPGNDIDWDDITTWHEPTEYPFDPNPLYYLLIDWWQANEIDRQADFDLCEFFFERYLLAEWEAIYERLYERE